MIVLQYVLQTKHALIKEEQTNCYRVVYMPCYG
jgi:hypothetical protein